MCVEVVPDRSPLAQSRRACKSARSSASVRSQATTPPIPDSLRYIKGFRQIIARNFGLAAVPLAAVRGTSEKKELAQDPTVLVDSNLAITANHHEAAVATKVAIPLLQFRVVPRQIQALQPVGAD